MWGINIRTSELPPFVEEVVEYPKHRFVEYGPEDEWWLLKFGYAKRITRPTSVIIQVDESRLDAFSNFFGVHRVPRIVYYMHPVMKEKLIKELALK